MSKYYPPLSLKGAGWAFQETNAEYIGVIEDWRKDMERKYNTMVEVDSFGLWKDGCKIKYRIWLKGEK